MGNPKVVVDIEVGSQITDIGAAASKALPPGRRYRYSVDVTYTLEDGEKYSSTIRELTKPKLKNAIERETRHVKQRTKSSEYIKDADCWISSYKYYIGV